MNSRFIFPLTLFVIFSLLLPIGSTGAAEAASPVEIFTTSGILHLVWGDGLPGQSPASVGPLTLLTDGAGRSYRLSLPDDLSLPVKSLLELNGRRMLVRGVLDDPAALEQPASEISLSVHSLALDRRPGLPETPTQPEDVSGPQPWVSILCKFSDNTNEPKALSYFTNMFANTAPGLDHYWREQSYDKINLVGSMAVGWYNLPQPRSYYVYNQDSDPELELNHSRAATDCTGVADADVYFPNFKGINLMFNGDLDGYAWGGSHVVNRDGQSKVYRMTWEPPWGYGNVSVMAHENGHGFGLPHSSGQYGQTYDNSWDVMSNAWVCTVNDPTYGCVGQHTISYHKDMLGWFDAAYKLTVPNDSRTTVTLERLALPQTSNYRMVKIPIGGSTSYFYTVEARKRAAGSYDMQLKGSGVIIHEVDRFRGIPAHVIDIDGNGNTGDAGAMWLPGETFIDSTNQITITVDSETTSGYVVTIELGNPPPLVCDEQAQIPEAECLALLDLFNTTSGDTWTDKTDWNSTLQPCDWHGVVCSGGHVSGLNLEDNNLDGSLPASLDDLDSLETLALGNNYLEGALPEEMQYLTSLTSLSLYNNSLSGSLPTWLGSLTNLQSLDLGYNNFSGSVPSSLGGLSNLVTLYLDANDLSGSLPASLAGLTSLYSLYLGYNRLEGSLPAWLEDLSGLTELRLESNRFSGSIPSELGSLTDLEQLNLAYNQLANPLPASLTALTGLSELDLGYNLFSTSDAGLMAFLNSHDPDWSQTQTVAPTNLQAVSFDYYVQLSWDAIPYTGDEGYYEISYALAPGGPWKSLGATLDKGATSYLAMGMPPGQTLYLRVRTHSAPHDYQQNGLWSDWTVYVTGQTSLAAVFAPWIKK
ncbi:MAG: hypothetical protein JXB15_12250 [Anaerolineales bacterium]|nr:hypothetical protein [Anaerolineales bacterium]